MHSSPVAARFQPRTKFVFFRMNGLSACNSSDTVLATLSQNPSPGSMLCKTPNPRRVAKDCISSVVKEGINICHPVPSRPSTYCHLLAISKGQFDRIGAASSLDEAKQNPGNGTYAFCGVGFTQPRIPFHSIWATLANRPVRPNTIKTACNLCKIRIHCYTSFVLSRSTVTFHQHNSSSPCQIPSRFMALYMARGDISAPLGHVTAPYSR